MHIFCLNASIFADLDTIDFQIFDQMKIIHIFSKSENNIFEDLKYFIL